MEDIKELKQQNRKLRKLVELYNNGQARIVMCSKCGIPLQSHENRIRVVYQKRGKSYNYSDRQIAVFHIKCWDKVK